MSESIEYKGYTINIHIDECEESPRTSCDNLGRMICFHTRYALGDNHEMNVEGAKGMENSNDIIALPLYLYDHSGLTMNTTGFSCPWDSGKVGFIYVTKEDVRKEYGWKVISQKRREQIEKYLRGEVETYDNFLTGSVYCYTITDPDGIELVDSCGGFYGYEHEKSGLMEYAKNAIDCHIKIEKEAVTA